MKRLIIASMATIALLAAPVMASGDLSRKDVIEVEMELGTDASGAMFMRPNHFEFVTGQAYKWEIKNVDHIKHELALLEFGEKIFTRKVQVEDHHDEMVVEVKGNITEVEVGPGQTVDWYFVPIQTVENARIICELEGHAEAGMHGTVTVR